MKYIKHTINLANGIYGQGEYKGLQAENTGLGIYKGYRGYFIGHEHNSTKLYSLMFSTQKKAKQALETVLNSFYMIDFNKIDPFNGQPHGRIMKLRDFQNRLER